MKRFSIQDGYQITLVDISCNSADWSSCSYRTDGHDCDHNEDIFLTCGSGRVTIIFKLTNQEIRLIWYSV